MKTLYKFKTIFMVKPDINSDKILAEFENDEIVTEDKADHAAFFGEGNTKARAYVEEHGGVIVRKVMCTIEQLDYSNDGYLYLKLRE